MEVNNRVKKVIAMLAVIDDTMEQIQRVKTELDERLRQVKSEYAQRITELRSSLQENHDVLETICGPEYDVDRVVRPATSRARQEREREASSFGIPTSDTQMLRARAIRYIGEEIINPTPEETEVESGQVLPDAN